MLEFFSSNGIEHQIRRVEIPQQNERVERKHQHILNVEKALLFQFKLPKHFWSYAILHATYLINLIPSPLILDKSPFFHKFEIEPHLTEIKVFGSLCYATTLQNHKIKLDSRARNDVFLRYKQNVNDVVIIDLNTISNFVSRHVIHHDHVLPYSNPNLPFSWKYHLDHNVHIDPVIIPTSTDHQAKIPID